MNALEAENDACLLYFVGIFISGGGGEREDDSGT